VRTPRLSAALVPALVATLAAMAACTGSDTDPTGDTDASTAVCTEPKEVSCEDDLILTLGMQDFVSTGAVGTTQDGGDFLTTIDATAGGFGQSDSNPWVYVRFTANGAEKVEIDDETALGDMSWHLAAKRFILRLNGGSSGPSCVGAAPFLEREYSDLTEVPAGTRFVEDDYYTEDCTIVNDSSGLPNSPQVAMGAWWEYPGCVQTTGVPFLVQLDSGEVIRVRVESYYATDQDVCNNTGTGGSGGGNLTLRWSFVE